MAISAILFYYFTVYVLCLSILSQTFNNELLEKIFISLTYFKTYIIYALFPFVVLLPDIAYNFIQIIYFPSPIDTIIYNSSKYLSEAKNKELTKDLKSRVDGTLHEESRKIKSDTQFDVNDKNGKEESDPDKPPSTELNVNNKILLENGHKRSEQRPPLKDEELNNRAGRSFTKKSITSLNNDLEFNVEKGKQLE